LNRKSCYESFTTFSFYCDIVDIFWSAKILEGHDQDAAATFRTIRFFDCQNRSHHSNLVETATAVVPNSGQNDFAAHFLMCFQRARFILKQKFAFVFTGISATGLWWNLYNILVQLLVGVHRHFLSWRVYGKT
jgi:hypothetical protein